MSGGNTAGSREVQYQEEKACDKRYPFRIIIIIIIIIIICIEKQRMWNLKCAIVPVVIGATGLVTRNLRKNFETVPGKHPIDSLQKTAILGTSHIIRKVLQCES